MAINWRHPCIKPGRAFAPASLVDAMLRRTLVVLAFQALLASSVLAVALSPEKEAAVRRAMEKAHEWVKREADPNPELRRARSRKTTEV